MKLRTTLAALATCAALSPAHAALGDYLVVATDGHVILSFEGSDAGYDSTLSVNGSPEIFPNHGTAVGETYDLGWFAAGTILEARLTVSSGDVFFSGPGSLNPDGYAHADVVEDWNGTGRTWVGFEDLLDTPDGSGDYDDHTFSFSNTFTSPVPEPAAALMLAMGLVGLRLSARRSRALPAA